jgi:hypothetical protein
MLFAKLTESPKSTKKYRVVLMDAYKQKIKTIDFGQQGASDYTIHKDRDRMIHYLMRHSHPNDYSNVRSPTAINSTKENWSDPRTAGFWSRWLLWSTTSITTAKRLITNKFHIRFIR